MGFIKKTLRFLIRDNLSHEAHLAHRLISIDAFRGFVMFLLIAEGAGIYNILVAPALKGTVLQAIGIQFRHHAWNGLRLWDLGLPLFMFISGVSMAFSFGRRWERGEKWAASFRHVLERCFLLFFLGWALYRIHPVDSNPHGSFLYDILPHLAFGGFVAFLMLRRSAAANLGLSFGLIVVTEVLYRLWPVAGFNQPFTPDHNFGAYIDVLLTGEVSEGHYVAFNMVPAAAYMIWGVLAGKLLRSPRTPSQRIRTLVFWGFCSAAAGIALSPITPIIRRIFTSSFVLISGGICLLGLAFAYWIIDVRKYRQWTMFAVVVGMNPLFIYLLTQLGAGEWFWQIVIPFTKRLFRWAGEQPILIITSLVVWGLLWSVCYWLYKKKIFIKI
jgi:predicted acyltransferase